MADHNGWCRKRVTGGAFVICFLVVGIPFWNIPYARVNLPNAFFGLGVIAVFVTGALLCFGLRFSLLRSTAIAALVFPAVLMARVAVEATIVTGRHNLWPLALVIAAMTGVVVAGAGALSGWLVRRILG